MKLFPGAIVSIVLFTSALSAQGPLSAVNQGEVRLITVEPGVRLEVKDWGGTGRPVVLLAGLGGTLKNYDDFAPQLTGRYHVYGITRRGYGASSAPDPVDGNYDADRLGDDVLSVVDQLKVERPVLIGHSFAGEELSSVCSRFPDRVAGLVYLDAAYRYAYSPADSGDFRIDSVELRRALTASLDSISPEEALKALSRLQELFPQYESDVVAAEKQQADEPQMSAHDYAELVKERSTRAGQIEEAALDGEHRYTQLKCPVLAIFALPHDQGLPPGPKRDAADARDMQMFGHLADRFEARVPNARVVRMAHAKHVVYESNPAEVIGEIDRFIGGLNTR